MSTPPSPHPPGPPGSPDPLDPYDEVPYLSVPLHQSHPDRLSALARLHGLAPALVERCRVLEIGVGDGANLIPMALGLPNAELVGVDLAARPIARGQQTIEALDLRNISLRCADLRDLARERPSPGERFDYIIAHGVYSWIPPDVREALLALIRAWLAPQGVAYVSYNAYPGGYLRQAVGEMMRYHTAGVERVQETIARAQGLARLMVEAMPDADEVASLRAGLRAVVARQPGGLFHDELAPNVQPFYFYEVVEQAAAHGLQYLAEADFWEMQASAFPPEAQAFLDTVEQARGWVAREQHLDFLKGRQFRQTLLCQAELPLRRTPTAADVTGLLVAAPVRPDSPAPDLRPGVPQQFHGPRGALVRIDLPLAKAAFLEIGAAWPDRLAFDDLLERAERRLVDASVLDGRSAGSDEAWRLLGDVVFDSYRAGLVQLYTWKPAVAPRAGTRPALGRLARLQAVRDDDPSISTLLHDFVVVEEPLTRQLLRLLDGTRDRAALLASLRGWARRQPDLAGIGTGSVNDEITLEGLEERLREFARAGLLTA